MFEGVYHYKFTNLCLLKHSFIIWLTTRQLLYNVIKNLHVESISCDI